MEIDFRATCVAAPSLGTAGLLSFDGDMTNKLRKALSGHPDKTSSRVETAYADQRRKQPRACISCLVAVKMTAPRSFRLA
jgi:hypothetical protein